MACLFPVPALSISADTATRSRRIAGPLLIAAGVVLCAAPAQAGNEIFQPTATCTGVNCGALFVDGTIKSFGTSAGKWVAEVFAKAGECFRLDVTGRLAPDNHSNLEMVVVAPNGTVYRNDNKGSGSCTDCPLVRIKPTPSEGWYTVSVGTSNGAAVDENFRIGFGRYAVANANCATATPPLGGASADDINQSIPAAPRPGFDAPGQ